MKGILVIFTVLFACTLCAQKPFVTTWKTDNPGSSDDRSITIPTLSSFSGDYNYEVDWDNDGKYDQSNITGNVSHTYKNPGTYTIKIRGVFPAIYFNNEGDRSKLIQIDQWGDNVWKTFLHAFYGCNNLEYRASDEPLMELTSMTSMFEDCTNFNGDIGTWDVSNVIHMNRMFYGATTFNRDIGAWDVSNLQFMSYMFADAVAFNRDIGDWDVSNVINMQYVFRRALAFNQDIGAWNVVNVQYTVGMFSGARNFNKEIGAWDVARVENMSAMFTEAVRFNQDIGAWDVSKVTDMSYMFYEAGSFNQDIGSWDIKNVESLDHAFDNSGIQPNNYDNILIGWSSSIPNLQHDVSFGALGMEYCYGSNSRMGLMYMGWDIDGDTMDCSETCNPGPVNITFAGMAGTNWSTIANWNLDFVPTPCFAVIIPSGQMANIQATFDASIFSIEVENGAIFEIENGGQLECLVGR